MQNFRITENKISSSLSFEVSGPKGIEVQKTSFYNIEVQGSAQSITVNEFATRASITPQAVRKMILEGRVIAINLGKQYIIKENELEKYLKNR